MANELHWYQITLAERDAEIVELNRRFNAQSDNFVAASITIGQLRAEIAQLKAQVAELQAWKDAAIESMSAGSALLFKQLRQDRVLRPI